jgi:transcription antitermination factor NusG
MTETWYAIRTAPGAQMPKREFVVETGLPRGKGYRIVPSLNAEVSAIERSLSENGHSHYMPVERKVIRSRTAAHTYTTRRFPLIPGYAFVRNVIDFEALEAVPGVVEVIRNQGRPFVIPHNDIDRVREWEQEAVERCRAHLWKLEQEAKRQTRKALAERFPSGSAVQFKSGFGKGMTGRILSVGRDGRMKAFVDGLNMKASVSIDDIEVFSILDAA